MRTLLLLILTLSSCLYSETQFGYISCSGYNIGDDIQALAAAQFLPKNSIGIDREFIGVFENRKKVATIINGWFMHTKDFAWYRGDVKAPKKSWPPSRSIDPLFISIYLWEGFFPTAFSEEGIAYLKKHGPIGARDYYTLEQLRKRDIPSYFSGCLTLTLKNKPVERNNIIYVVDLDDECVNYIKAHTNCQVETVTHILTQEQTLDQKWRLKRAKALLKMYQNAHCVISCRLHATMPCLALTTPTLLIDNLDNHRFDGLRELVRHCTRKELLSGKYNFDFNNPPQNPKDYLQVRERLLETVSKWVGVKTSGQKSQQAPLSLKRGRP